MSNFKSFETILGNLQEQNLQIEKKISNLELYLLTNKAVLTFEEAASYTGLSKSYLYKLTSTAKIPCYKPQGKMIYFDRLELDNWLLRSQAIAAEIEVKASTYVTLNKRGGKA
jgi:excisionase family DNA binding protein